MTTPAKIREGESDYGLRLFVDSLQDQRISLHRCHSVRGGGGFSRERYHRFTNHNANGAWGMSTAVLTICSQTSRRRVRPAPSEDADVTARARTLFGQIQAGTKESSLLGAKLMRR